METVANPEALLSGAAGGTPARLGYPPPPDVCVTLSETEATGLNRLCRQTGLTSGEVAAILLAEHVSSKSAQETFSATAGMLGRLHDQRRQELRIKTTPAIAPKLNPRYATSMAGPIRVPLSAALNEQLYKWAIESSLTRRETAQILLRKSNLKALAEEISRPTSPGRSGRGLRHHVKPAILIA